MRRLIIGIATAVVLGSAGGGLLYRAYTAHDSSILIDTPTAAWIKAAKPTYLGTHDIVPLQTAFLRSFRLTKVPAVVALRVRSFRRSLVSVNGVPLKPLSSGTPPWVAGDHYEIAAELREGDNLVVVVVENDHGPASLLMEGDLAELSTGPDWQTHTGKEPIGGVQILAERLREPNIQNAFPTAAQGLQRVGPYLASIFVLGAVAALALMNWGKARARAQLTPSGLRWLLMGAWALLCANNLLKLPLKVAFDVVGHVDYIVKIAEGKLPIATDGWQMFQSPLYYLITGGLYALASLTMKAPQAIYAARLVPMLCGLALIGIAYRSAGRVFASRPDLQLVALAVAGTMPMSFYICQEVGNEPLAGAIGAALLDLCLLEIATTEGPSPVWRGARLGGLFGLALLAKITLLLILPALVWVLWLRLRGQPASARIKAGASFAAAVVIVSGWYFVRNWIRLGHLFMDGWDPARGIAWWQDPGYRTLNDLLRFGDGVTRPIWSVLSGYWDGLYATTWLDGDLSSQIYADAAPPWNYDFMVALAPLALPLTLAILVGVALIPFTRERIARLSLAMLAGVWLCFLGAIAYVFLTLPIYSTVKGTYALALVPALGLLAARGLQPVVDRRWGRVAVAGYLSAWAACVFAAFWVR
jgi:hypothetical protein